MTVKKGNIWLWTNESDSKFLAGYLTAFSSGNGAVSIKAQWMCVLWISCYLLAFLYPVWHQGLIWVWLGGSCIWFTGSLLVIEFDLLVSLTPQVTVLSGYFISLLRAIILYSSTNFIIKVRVTHYFTSFDLQRCLAFDALAPFLCHSLCHVVCRLDPLGVLFPNLPI